MGTIHSRPRPHWPARYSGQRDSPLLRCLDGKTEYPKVAGRFRRRVRVRGCRSAHFHTGSTEPPRWPGPCTLQSGAPAGQRCARRQLLQRRRRQVPSRPSESLRARPLSSSVQQAKHGGRNCVAAIDSSEFVSTVSRLMSTRSNPWNGVLDWQQCRRAATWTTGVSAFGSASMASSRNRGMPSRIRDTANSVPRGRVKTPMQSDVH